MKLAIFLIALLTTFTGHAAQQCLIVGVADGDTVTARCGAAGSFKQLKIRLTEIDAPESKQAFGARSKQSLSDLCFQKQAVITGDKLDKYGRTLARVNCQGQDAALYQAQRGMAWAYTQYLSDPAVKQAESVARGEKIDAKPVAPWLWRQDAKTATIAPTAPAARIAKAGSVCHTGKRGGTYTITASGRKNYGGC